MARWLYVSNFLRTEWDRVFDVGLWDIMEDGINGRVLGTLLVYQRPDALPDGGTTLALVALGMAGIVIAKRRG